MYILLPESFNLLTVLGFWSLYNSVLKAKKPSEGICLLLLLPLKNMPFHVLIVEMNMVMSLVSQKLCSNLHLIQSTPWLLLLTYFRLIFRSSASLTY